MRNPIEIKLPIDEIEALIDRKHSELLQKFSTLMAIQQPDEWLTTKQASKILQVSRTTLEKKRKRGEIKGHRTNPNSDWRYKLSEINSAYTD